MLAASYPWNTPPTYEPGVCNIGAAEIAARRRSGHAGLIVTLLGLVALAALDAPPAWRLLLFLPAAAAAAGYLQAAFRFCANFGLRGVFNFSEELRKTESVVAAEARARDRLRAFQIAGLSVVAGAVVAAAAYLLPI